MAAALAQLDVLANLAERAEALNLTRPQFVEEPGIAIRGGRHPVVERQVEHYVPNDVTLGAQRRLLIVTGLVLIALGLPVYWYFRGAKESGPLGH